MKLKLFIVTLLTIVWLILGVIFFLNKTSISEISISDLGNFLGGFLSPIALFWLVYGYIQQGHELQQNTKMLNKQREEYLVNIELLAYSALQKAYLQRAVYLNKLTKKKKKEDLSSDNNQSSNDKEYSNDFIGAAVKSFKESNENVTKIEKLLDLIQSRKNDNF